MKNQENMPKEAKLTEQAIKDLTPARAQSIFENKVINNLNETLPANMKVNSSEKLKFQWDLDKNTHNIVFSVIKRSIENEEADDEAKTYVIKTDPETGEKYREEKLTTQFSPKEKVTSYILENDDVKKTFQHLEPEVKKTFLDGWRESLTTSKKLAKKWTNALDNTMRKDEQEELKKRIKEEEAGQEELEKMLQALE